MARRAGAARPGGPGRSGPGAGRGFRPGRRGPARAARRRAAAESTADGADAGRTARRAPGGLTGRAAVLGLVVCALVLSLAYPAKEFLAQRGDISRLQQQQRDAQARVAALEERRRQLSDPAYVRAQARERLHFVLPGETMYVVARPSGGTGAGGAAPDLPVVAPDGSWYGRLWGTVRAADGATAP